MTKILIFAYEITKKLLSGTNPPKENQSVVKTIKEIAVLVCIIDTFAFRFVVKLVIYSMYQAHSEKAN